MSRLSEGRGRPGEALDDALKIACGDGAVRLVQVQREGKGRQSNTEFVRGFPVAEGAVVG